MNEYSGWHRIADSPWIHPELASSEGIVGVGGDLSPETLLNAYTHGIFPWFNEGDPFVWWSPDPRCILDLNDYHVPRRLAATIRKNKFEVTMDRAFEHVIRGCADRGDDGHTWITRDMIEAYIRMHHLGYAHSVETWLDGQLVGGIYGVSLGGLFAGESMFYRVSDASKVALVKLAEHLKSQGYALFDIQILNEHTKQFHAKKIDRSDYLARLRQALKLTNVRFLP